MRSTFTRSIMSATTDSGKFRRRARMPERAAAGPRISPALDFSLRARGVGGAEARTGKLPVPDHVGGSDSRENLFADLVDRSLARDVHELVAGHQRFGAPVDGGELALNVVRLEHLFARA